MKYRKLLRKVFLLNLTCLKAETGAAMNPDSLSNPFHEND
jgi:hypothetical protein